MEYKYDMEGEEGWVDEDKEGGGEGEKERV